MGFFDTAKRLPSAKFPEIGATVSGKVVELVEASVPVFDNKGRIVQGESAKDTNGDDLVQIDVTLWDGDNRFVLHTGGAIFYAIGLALATLGADDLEPGDTLTVTYTGDGEPTAKGRNAPKQYSAEIVKGTGDTAADSDTF